MVRNPRRGMANWLGMAQRAGVVKARTLQAQEELARARRCKEQLARTQEARGLPTECGGGQACRTRSRAEAAEQGRPIGLRSFTRMARGHIPWFGSRWSHHLGWLLGAGRAGRRSGTTRVLGSRWPHDTGQADLAQARAAWSVRAQVLLAQGAAGACLKQHRPCWPRRS